jgi:hypothetical protein
VVLVDEAAEDGGSADAVGGQVGDRRPGSVFGVGWVLVARSRSSRRRVPTRRSQSAFALGAWGGVLMISMPQASNTASKACSARKPDSADGLGVMRRGGTR